jgi:LacI family transcriptional regulator
MNDVAREAGVALKTVSRFVNGETNINPALSARIRDAISKLGYRRNLAAASIRPGWTSKVLGLIISDLANPYYSMLTRSIEAYARDHGYLLISASSDEDGRTHDELVDRMMEQRVDGLLIVPPRHTGRPWMSVTPPIPPLVFLDRPTDYDGAECILADNAGGSQDAVRVLIEKGARRVAFIGDSLSIYTMGERFRGYSEALAQAEIPMDDALVYTTAHQAEQAAAIVEELLRDSDADAIFAANNRSAVGALIGFRQTGRRIPLIGFDDFEAATLSDPEVSVVSQDIAEMGRKAAELLISRLTGSESAGKTHTLPTALILRGSEHL